MTGMLEKAAEAVCEEYGWPGSGPVRKDFGINIARAVLMAIREPNAVCVIDACVKTVDANGHAHPPAMFTAMIDAILNETPE